MMEKIKDNTKLKLLSFMSALFLWLYVMAVVDPEETKLIENLPITINNMSEITNNNLVIYPEAELTADIYVTGKLSDLQKIKSQDINVYAQILNPIEGKNELYLKATISQRVTYEFKSSIVIIDLEKIIEQEMPIEINVEGTSKEKIAEEVTLSMQNVNISGPRSLVKEVNKIIGTINVKEYDEDFSQEITLIPVDADGEEVFGITLDNESILVDVKMLKQKSVPIEIKLKDESEVVENYKLSQNNITIKGKKDVVDKIDKIYTTPVDLKKFIENGGGEISLNIPEGITTDIKSVKITINSTLKNNSEFSYTKDEIKINNANDIDISTLNIPDTIKVVVEYSSEIGNLEKSDISLYIDLSQPTQDKKYEIKYQSDYQFTNITITPNVIEEGQ